MENQKMNPWMVSTLVLVGVMVGFGVSQIPALKGVNFFGKATVNPTTADTQNTQDTGPKALTSDQIAALPDDDPSIGELTAPITMVEFSDFECPYCSRFFKDTLPQIEENYIKTGKVRLVYRDFLIDGHNEAPYAALAAECTHEQGKFREMHDALFSAQQEWVENPKAQSVMDGYAKKIGVDMTKYNSCISTKKYGDEIRKDIIDGISLGVNGTPTFFINGKEASGALPYSVFSTIFDAQLAGKQWVLQFDARGNASVKVN